MREILTDAAAIGNAAGRTHSKLFLSLILRSFAREGAGFAGLRKDVNAVSCGPPFRHSKAIQHEE
jgi:hypothetical protein